MYLNLHVYMYDSFIILWDLWRFSENCHAFQFRWSWLFQLLFWHWVFISITILDWATQVNEWQWLIVIKIVDGESRWWMKTWMTILIHQLLQSCISNYEMVPMWVILGVGAHVMGDILTVTLWKTSIFFTTE